MINFLKLIKAEIKNIKWPTKKTVIISSALVLIICAIISIYLYAVDYVLKITVLENKIKYSQANNQTDNKTDENIINIDELKATTTNQ